MVNYCLPGVTTSWLAGLLQASYTLVYSYYGLPAGDDGCLAPLNTGEVSVPLL